MKFSEVLTLSKSNLKRQKGRSALATIGIAVGVATVISLMTLANSFQTYFTTQYNATFLPNAFSVQPPQTDVTVNGWNAGPALYAYPEPIFSPHDVGQIGSMQAVGAVIPYTVEGGVAGIEVGGAPINTSSGFAVTSISFKVFSQGVLQLQQGSRLPANSSQVVVGSQVAQAIAYEVGSTNDTSLAVGKDISITTTANDSVVNATIAGVLKPWLFGSSMNYMIFTPLGTPSSSQQTTAIYNGILVLSGGHSSVQAAQADVLGYLNGNSNALSSLKSWGLGLSFTADSEQGAMAFLQGQIAQYSAIILAMGLISLIGGAVGISNFMLVAVTERTREIGVIKAIGGTSRDVVEVFLLEAAALSSAGALLGVLVGSAVGYGLTKFQILGLNLPLAYNLSWFPIAAALGVSVGLISGLYPAWKAATMPPIVALRYE